MHVLIWAGRSSQVRIECGGNKRGRQRRRAEYIQRGRSKELASTARHRLVFSPDMDSR
jgi:hypothetical protein